MESRFFGYRLTAAAALMAALCFAPMPASAQQNQVTARPASPASSSAAPLRAEDAAKAAMPSPILSAPARRTSASPTNSPIPEMRRP